MEFLYPNFLFIIPLFLVLIIFKKFFFKKTTSIQVSNFNSLKNFFGYQGKVKVFLINSLFIVALVSIIIGLARPRISSVDKDITVEVIDIVLVLDTSSSMLADDFKPNRLEAVKDAAKEFIEKVDPITILNSVGLDGHITSQRTNGFISAVETLKQRIL